MSKVLPDMDLGERDVRSGGKRIAIASQAEDAVEVAEHEVRVRHHDEVWAPVSSGESMMRQRQTQMAFRSNRRIPKLTEQVTSL